jgi:predicted dehydrogenase
MNNRAIRKIVIIGLGAAARRIHLPAYAGLPGAQVVAACDPIASDGKRDFPVYDSLEHLLSDQRPDVGVVASPTASHFPIARQLIERGIHVLCEKPFTNQLAEAVELVRLAAAHHVRLAVNNEFRFMACHQAAQKLIGDPRFGELRFVNMVQTFYATAESEVGWRGSDPERTCKEFGTHVFDLCRFFFGTEPIRLRAHMPRPGGPGTARPPDLLNLIDLQFPGDRWARITLNRVTTGRHRYLDIQLDGTAGSVETSLGGHAEVALGLNAPSRRPYVHADISLGSRAYLYHGEGRQKLASDSLNIFADATRRLMQGFLESLDTGALPPCHGSDNLRTFALMRAAYDSAATDRDVDLSFLQALP